MAILLVAWADPTFGQNIPLDVTTSFSISRSGLVLNRNTNTYDTIVTLTNISPNRIVAPLRLVISPNQTTVAVSNKTGITSDGQSFIDVPLIGGAFPVGESLKQKLSFSNPARVSFLYSVQILTAASDSIAIKILEPLDTTALTTPDILVRGTLTAPSGTTVTINGQPACVDQEEFYLNGLVLDTTPISIIARAITPLGEAKDANVQPSVVGALRGFIVTGDDCGGVAPYKSTFAISLVGLEASDILRLDVDMDGDGRIDASSPIVTNPIIFTYTAPKRYLAKFVLYTKSGASYTSYRRILVQDALTAGQPFVAIISNLRNALTRGDVPTALTYFTGASRSRYSALFQQIGPSLLASVSATWSAPAPIEIGDQFAEYGIHRVVDGVTQQFRILFIRDGSGSWKIDSI